MSCSEEQLKVLVGLLTHSLAFGYTSSWGTDVFIEIGSLAGILFTFTLLIDLSIYTLLGSVGIPQCD